MSEAAIDTPKDGCNKLRYISRTWFESILRFNASASLWQTLAWAFLQSWFSCKCICQLWNTQKRRLSYKTIKEPITVKILTEWETTRSFRTKETGKQHWKICGIPASSWVNGYLAHPCRHQLRGRQGWAGSWYSSRGLSKLSQQEPLALMWKALSCLRLGLCNAHLSFWYTDTNTICCGDGLLSHCSRSWKSWPALHVKNSLYNRE